MRACGTSITNPNFRGPAPTTAARSRRRIAARGFTLAESLIAATVLGIAVAGAVAPIIAQNQQRQAAEQTSIAVELGKQLLDEMAAKPVVDPSDYSTTLGPEADEVGRAAFDNVDDYHNYKDSTDGSDGVVMKMADGSTIQLSRQGVYKRKVTVEYRADPNGAAAAGGDFAMATVTVTLPRGGEVVVHRLFTKHP